MLLSYEELKRAAKFNQAQSEHFGTPAGITVPVSVILDLIADADRLSWLNKQSLPVIDGQSYANPEGELVAYRWTVEEQCADIRTAIDIMANRMQP